MKQAQDLVAQAKQQINEVHLDHAPEAIAQADLLIDVREPAEFDSGHLQGAINIPRGLLEFTLSGTPEYGDRDLNIVIYCKTSGRAALAALSLKEMGYANIISFDGGFDAWVAAGNPTQ